MIRRTRYSNKSRTNETATKKKHLKNNNNNNNVKNKNERILKD